MFFSGLKKISFILDRNSKIKFSILIILLLFRSLLEGFGLGLIAPFLAAIGKPSLILENEFFIYFNTFLQIDSNKELILFASIALVAYFVIKNLFIFFTTYFQARLIFSDRANQSHKLFSYYMRAPYTFHLEHHSAQLDRNIRYEIPKVYQFIEASLHIFTNIVLVSSIFVLLMFVKWEAVIGISLIMGLVALVILILSNRSSKKFGEELFYSQFRLGQSLKEGFSTIVESKLSNIEHFFPRKYLDHYLVTARSQWRQITINSAPILIFETVAVCLIVILVILLAVEGEILLEILPLIGVFAFAFIRLLPASNLIVRNLNSLEFVYPAVREIHEEFEKFDRFSEKTHEVPKPINFSSLEFNDVSFSYEESNLKVIKNISFKLNKSESIAFIGTSGSGKTTLLNLLVGLLDPSEGNIKLNGEDLKKNIYNFRSSIGYVPQNINLVDASIKENISLGIEPEKIDAHRIKQVIKEACLDSFIETLSEKENTIIGENGARLSGGQRQRLGIARALYHDPEILIFDEATSSLDSKTESMITKEIMQLSEERTMIFISHRINTLKGCNTIYSLENGYIRVIDDIDNITS